MKIPSRRPAQFIACFNPAQSKKLYNTLVLLEYLMERISPNTHWKNRLMQLMDNHPIARPAIMGFPDGWRHLSIWKM